MSNKSTPPNGRTPKSQIDYSKIDLGFIEEAAHAGSRFGPRAVPEREDIPLPALEEMKEIVATAKTASRPVRVYARLTEDEAVMLGAYAVKSGQNRTDAVREAVRHFIESDTFRRTLTKT